MSGDPLESRTETVSALTLLQRFIGRGISRRRFVTGLAAAGIGVSAARALGAEFSPFSSLPDATDAERLPSWARVVTGTGGQLLVEQLKAADTKYLFITPSSGHAPILDALIDETNIKLVQVLHEGALAAVADGYARASRKTPFLMMARPGLPNAMTQMFNAWKDHVGMVVMVDDVEVDSLGQDGFEDIDHMTSMTAPDRQMALVRAERTEDPGDRSDAASSLHRRGRKDRCSSRVRKTCSPQKRRQASSTSSGSRSAPSCDLPMS